MKQAALLDLYSGGPGSGCQGENCGRPKSGLMKTLEQIKDAKLWDDRNVWVKLANYGHEGLVASFSKEELSILKRQTPSPCKIGFCFQNAQQIAAWNEDSNLKYMEGLVSVHGVPLDHAWVEYNGKVYDPTLANYKPDQEPDYTRGGKFKNFGEDRPKTEYVGVAVPKDEISKYQMRTGQYGPLSYEHRNESLQKKIWRK